ncbi:cytochrome P450 family protein [Actinomadura fibrosa]|uniref:Cytochrome P450 n=1 Tax=Actinomadura fibrosa TaxID=111802 RepID=A0ABW2XSZ7_9ACTN|nr:cytochrome P450 [Actinomadura fibrosa]
MADHPTSQAEGDVLDDAGGPLAGLLADAAGFGGGDRVLDAGFRAAAGITHGPGTLGGVIVQQPDLCSESAEDLFRAVHRVLHPGGVLVAADAVPLDGRHAARIRGLAGWGSLVPDGWGDRRAWAERLGEAGFVDVEVRGLSGDDHGPLVGSLRRRLRAWAGRHLPADALDGMAEFEASTEYVLVRAVKPVDPESPELVRDPFTAYSEIRERTRMVRAAMTGVEPFWMVTRYDDAKTVLSDPRFVVNAANVPGMADTASRIEQFQLASGIAPEHVEYSRASLSSLDGADHHRLRRLVSQAFTPRRVAGLRPRVEEITERLLDRLPEVAEDGVVDLLMHFATPLPLTVICELVGVPEDERNRFRAAVWDWMIGSGSGGGAGGARRRVRRETAFDYVRGLVERRRARPENDLASALIRVHDEDGDRLSDGELVYTILSLVVAGYHTTTHFITNGTAALLTHPDQLALLRERPELMPRAVEELLRWCNPVLGAHFRYATEDLDVGGRPVRKGEPVMPIVPGANYDPRVFDGPDRLDLTRDGGRDHESHLSFGHGLHYCLGAALARQEGAVAFEALLRRFPDLALAVDPGDLKHGSDHFWRLLSLPVRISAGRAE